MLRTKLFKVFAGLVLAFGVLTAFFVIRTVQARIMDEAQQRVRLNFGSAWAVYQASLKETETVLRLLAAKRELLALCQAPAWDNPELQSHLEQTRIAFGLDFLSLISPDGKVRMRCAPPYNAGDFRLSNASVAAALQGEGGVALALLSDAELQREADGLAERACLALDSAPGTRPISKTAETRGMVIEGAFPIRADTRLVGVIYGGLLLNRNEQLVDHIRDSVFRDATYEGRPIGSATLFLDDSRIATTVRLPNGNRALGTRASREVADRVLDNGTAWIGPASVLNERYLSAYAPLCDARDRIIGMLYIGTLEKPFRDQRRQTTLQYGALALLTLSAALIFAFFYAARLAAPTHRLVQAADQMRTGRYREPVPRFPHASEESNILVDAFNQMAGVLVEREGNLLDAKAKLEKANESLSNLNRDYMDMLEFVAHELKTPVSSILTYTYLIRTGKLGPLNERQGRALQTMDNNLKRIMEMLRHYLNLSRIETGELAPHPVPARALEDIVQPLLDSFEAELQQHRITVVNRIPAAMMLRVDLNLIREVFENLISNAIKYGREGGTLTLTGCGVDGLARFGVRNEGDGIPLDKREAVFQKFTRLTGTPAVRAHKGTGLGLFITRAIVEAHRGTITVESHPGEWIEFRFTLPRIKEEEK